MFWYCSDLHFGFYTLVWCIGMEYGTFVGHPLILGRHVFSAGGELTPPPWSRAPRQESRTSWSIMCTHVLLLELHNCTLLGVWIYQGIVLAWDRI